MCPPFSVTFPASLLSASARPGRFAMEIAISSPRRSPRAPASCSTSFAVHLLRFHGIPISCALKAGSRRGAGGKRSSGTQQRGKVTLQTRAVAPEARDWQAGHLGSRSGMQRAEERLMETGSQDAWVLVPGPRGRAEDQRRGGGIWAAGSATESARPGPSHFSLQLVHPCKG